MSKVGFGKYANHDVEELLLDQPDYVIHYALAEARPTGPLFGLCMDALRLIAVFDALPYVVPCECCGRTATRCMVRLDDPRPSFWCDLCNPPRAGEPGRVATCEVRSYQHAGAYFRWDELRVLIRRMARAKGVSGRIMEVAKAAGIGGRSGNTVRVLGER